jgi:predicted methyltransferase
LTPASSTNVTTNVRVTIVSDNATSIEYKIGSGSWTTYTAPVVLDRANGNVTLQARGINSSGTSAVASGSYTFLPIPSAPILSPASAINSTSNITVTITSANATSIDYKINSESWRPYTAPVVLNRANGNVILQARGVNSGAGPITSGSYTFFQSITPVPSTPTLSPASATNSTSNVTVTITSNNATSIEYKIGSGSWTAYTAPVVLNRANGNVTLQARGINSSGTSAVASGSYNFQSIVPVPSTPVLTTSSTKNSTTITVTITSANATSIEYKIGSGSWTAYTVPVVLNYTSSYPSLQARGINSSGTSPIAVLSCTP